ncbi:helix-turn-helix domain-containing protein [Nitrosococcus halophilus]
MPNLYNLSCLNVNNYRCLNGYNTSCNLPGMNLGERLKKARLEANMTQRQLAETSGVKQQMISKLEVGRASETSDIVSLAKALGVRSEWLDSGEEPMRLGEYIADTVKRLREEQGWSQSELARRVKVKPQNIQQLEDGTVKQPRYLMELARVFGVTVEELSSGGPRSKKEETPEYVLRLSRLIASASPEKIRAIESIIDAPPEKVQAILTLLGVKEEAIYPLPHKERRSGRDRRQNVHEVDFERRSGLDRRDDEAVIMEPGESLADFLARQEKEKNKKKDKEP